MTRSPQLTLPDSFLWGTLNGKIYMNKIRTIDDIDKIFCGIAAIPANTLQRVFTNFEHHVQ
jgi:hypothetical protein